MRGRSATQTYKKIEKQLKESYEAMLGLVKTAWSRRGEIGPLYLSARGWVERFIASTSFSRGLKVGFFSTVYNWWLVYLMSWWEVYITHWKHWGGGHIRRGERHPPFPPGTSNMWRELPLDYPSMAHYGTKYSRFGFYKLGNVWCHEDTASLWVAGLTAAVVVGLLILGLFYVKGCFEVTPYIAGAIAGVTSQYLVITLARVARGAAIGVTILIHDYVAVWMGWFFFWLVIHYWFFFAFPIIMYRCWSKARQYKKSIRLDPEILARTKKDWINRLMARIIRIFLLAVWRVVVSTLFLAGMGYIGYMLPMPLHLTIPTCQVW